MAFISVESALEKLQKKLALKNIHKF